MNKEDSNQQQLNNKDLNVRVEERMVNNDNNAYARIEDEFFDEHFSVDDQEEDLNF